MSSLDSVESVNTADWEFRC